MPRRHTSGRSVLSTRGRGPGETHAQIDAEAIRTVDPKAVARAFNIKETVVSKKCIGHVAANESNVDTYGEKRIVGHMGSGKGVSMNSVGVKCFCGS